MCNDKIILAIETSCDETSVALLKGGRKVLSNVISSQIEVHKLYGGVVPEIASRNHSDHINLVIKEAMDQSGLSFKAVELVAVTNRPGLIGALLIGVASAKAIAFSLGVPLIGVNHLEGHLAANYIEYSELKPPFIGLIVSGGHTNLAKVTGYNDFTMLGKTRDDALGEAFDKVARILGLGYPGGPLIDQLYEKGNPEAIPFKRVLLEEDTYDFSFSGIKTGVLNYVNQEKQKHQPILIEDVAASFQQSVIEVVVEKTIRAALAEKMDKIVLAGGVAANKLLRNMLKKRCEDEQIQLFYPSLDYCTDNAAMIGCAGYYKYMELGPDELDMEAYSTSFWSK